MGVGGRGRGRVGVEVEVRGRGRVGVEVRGRGRGRGRVEDVGAHADAEVDVGHERCGAAFLHVQGALESVLPFGEVLVRVRGRVRDRVGVGARVGGWGQG